MHTLSLFEQRFDLLLQPLRYVFLHVFREGYNYVFETLRGQLGNGRGWRCHAENVPQNLWA